MQRTLVMIRHAKSSWANPLQSDFERPLNKRGEHEAQEMGNLLKKMGLVPDLLICSKAKRTRQTAKRIADAVSYDKELIQKEEKLYHCISSVFDEVIFEIDDSIQTVFIVAHNPGITEFVNYLSHEFKVMEMPTCGIAAIQFDADEWNQLPLADRKKLFFKQPDRSNVTA